MMTTLCHRCQREPVAFRLRLYAEVDLRQVTPVALAEDGLGLACLNEYRAWMEPATTQRIPEPG